MEPWMKKCCLTYFVFTVETFLFIVDSFFRIGFNMSVACFCKSVTSRSPPRPDPGHLRTRVSMCFHRGESLGFVKIYIYFRSSSVKNVLLRQPHTIKEDKAYLQLNVSPLDHMIISFTTQTQTAQK